MSLERPRRPDGTTDAPRRLRPETAAAEVRNAFDVDKEASAATDWRRCGDERAAREDYDGAIRAYTEAKATDRLLELAERLLRTDGLLFLAEDAFVAAGRRERLSEIGDVYVSQHNDAAAIEMYSAARAWDKLASLQRRIEQGG